MKKSTLLIAAAALICGSANGFAQPQWQFQTTISATNPLGSLEAASREVAWASSADNTVYKTTNGGRNWLQTSSVTTTESLECLEALDSTAAFVGGGGPNRGGGNAKIYRTTNGGLGWEDVYTATGPASYWNAIHFFDAQNGIAMSDPPNPGEPFLIVKTTNGGATWTPIANPPTPRADEYGTNDSFYFYDDMNGWFGTVPGTQVAMAGRVFRTTDGGNTWNGFESGNASAVVSVTFISSMVGIRVSVAAPFLTRTTDGGQTWTPVDNLPVADIRIVSTATSVSTASGHQLWADGRAGASQTPFIISSVDGGATWHQQSIAPITIRLIGPMSAVSFGASNDSVRAWASAVNGSQILTYLNRIGQITAVKEEANIPISYSLSQNYPNPFWSGATSPALGGGNPSTTISYSIPTPQFVKLQVYDVLGHEVATLVNERKAAGSYQANFEAGKLTSGIYFYRLEAGDPSAGPRRAQSSRSGQGFVEIKKMILVR